MNRRLEGGLRASDGTRSIGKDLGARRRLVEFAEVCDLVLGELQLDPSRRDRSDLLRRDVAGPAEQARRDGEPVEDVVARIPDHLVDGADVLTLRVDDLPAVLDDEPGDGV